MEELMEKALEAQKLGGYRYVWSESYPWHLSLVWMRRRSSWMKVWAVFVSWWRPRQRAQYQWVLGPCGQRAGLSAELPGRVDKKMQ